MKIATSLFDLGRDLARNNDANGLDRAMSEYVGVERQEVLDGWFEGALERAVEAYTLALRAVPYHFRNDAISAAHEAINPFKS